MVTVVILKLSLKTQIIAAYALLAAPLLVLAYLSYAMQATFLRVTKDAVAREEVFKLTAALQRDVMDLQRNALMYKDSASEGAKHNTEQLAERLLVRITSLQSSSLLQGKRAEIDRMQQYLTDFMHNFSIVIDNRSQQKVMEEQFLKRLSPNLFGALINLSQQDDQPPGFLAAVLAAHQAALSYIATNDYTQIKVFQDSIGVVSAASGKRHVEFNGVIHAYRDHFLKMIHLKRNYIFLINVVMAGSAKEILYYADVLKEFSEQAQQLNRQEMAAQLEAKSRILLGFLVLGVTLILFSPIYFLGWIVRPIQSITSVFSRLSKEEVIGDVPGVHRHDEIGLLARSAEVFKDKNEQTVALLDYTRKSVVLQRELNQKLAEAKNDAEKALSVKSDFLANMSHELRTPLNSVIGYTVRLLKTGDFNARQLSALHAIERNGKHLLAMINDILDLSKIEANKFELHYLAVNLVGLCEDVLDQIRPAIDEKKLQFKWVGLDNPVWQSETVMTDPIRLAQILINLLSNAVKYTDTGAITLVLRDNREAIQPEPTLTLDVQDTGVGIRPEDCAKLFKRFEQLHADTRFKVGEGTGLGLAIVDQLARLLGARVSVSSQIGQGSCFSLTLPWVAGGVNQDIIASAPSGEPPVASSRVA
jgi:signal transduction histidine kinase